ncbi:metalloregulator ArsR/SmtB family transcription factor [Microbacterium awajiense]|uniref:Metalloregulator ArsR/SmtB family transcription factor n=1 Tax=Microbacterium awajiense TaxID=415214 RepID=A0ABP7AZQ0_9MICO
MATSELDRALTAVSNPHRRAVLDLLAERPATAAQAAQHANLSLPAFDRHLRVLVTAGLVQRRKVGRTNYLAIRRAGLRIVRDWIGGYDVDWGSDDETLDNYLEALSRDDHTTPHKEQQ